MEEGQLLWTPSEEFARHSNISRYMKWLEEHRNLVFKNYEDLRMWSVSDIENFWSSIWEYFDVQSSAPYASVIDQRIMPGAKWFKGSLVNYAEHLLRAEALQGDQVVLHHGAEFRPFRTMTWSQLGRQVRTVATRLRAMGVVPGDRVVAYMPNVSETLVAMLATMAVGAVWSSAAPEFGVKTVIERFSQIEPKVVFAADGYRFAGKNFRRENEVADIVAALPSVEHLVWCPMLEGQGGVPAGFESAVLWSEILASGDVPREAFEFERVECDHPLWILFSSGTTGLPKAIVHSHVGVLVEHLKMMHFHVNLGPESVMFFYTTTGWVMFNMLVGALLTGAAIVLYDGSPTYPGPELLWDVAARTGVTSFGASPTYVQILEKAGYRPCEHFGLEQLESIFVSGAPATPETFSWFYESVKQDLWLTSQSGGTEVAGAFVGAVPLLPVYAGEIQCRCLGMDVQAWDDAGHAIIEDVGELVVPTPFPSMPVQFWKDEGGKRYRESYFDVYENCWRHGDFIRINERGGCFIKGRSDSTLNRHGVRIGTAEIYRTVEQIDGIADSLIVCCELPGGNFFMPLFLVLKGGAVLDQALRNAIVSRLRSECSPRHVPDQIYVVDAVPYTLSGKKMEVPVRKILMGVPAGLAASRDAMKNPEAIGYFERFAQDSSDYQWRGAAA